MVADLLDAMLDLLFGVCMHVTNLIRERVLQDYAEWPQCHRNCHCHDSAERAPRLSDCYGYITGFASWRRPSVQLRGINSGGVARL